MQFNIFLVRWRWRHAWMLDTWLVFYTLWCTLLSIVHMITVCDCDGSIQRATEKSIAKCSEAPFQSVFIIELQSREVPRWRFSSKTFPTTCLVSHAFCWFVDNALEWLTYIIFLNVYRIRIPSWKHIWSFQDSFHAISISVFQTIDNILYRTGVTAPVITCGHDSNCSLNRENFKSLIQFLYMLL